MAASATPERFAGYASSPDLVSVSLEGGRSVGFGVLGAADVPGRASGSTVSYEGIEPDASARFTAETSMVKEQLTLSSPAAPSRWVFPLDLTGVTARPGTDGEIEFTSSAGSVLALVPHGFMTDSAIGAHSGLGAHSPGVSYTLGRTSQGSPAIIMTLNKAWLDSRARVFPVTVDPSITVKTENSSGQTYVDSQLPADNSTDTEIHVGTYDGGTNVDRSLLKFGSVSTDLANDNVLGVRLGLFNSWSYSCSPRTIYAYPITSSWSVTGVKTWPGPSIGSSIGHKTFATGWVPEGSTQSPCPSKWEPLDLSQAGTALVYGWAHGAANNGIALGASHTDNYAWKKSTSDNNPTGDPFLAITYTTDGASYELASKTPVTQITSVQNGALRVKVTNTGASEWTPTNGYELSYEVYDAKGKLVASHPVFTPMPNDVEPGGSATVDATVDKLPVGAYTIDFDMYSGALSSPKSFSSEFVSPMPVGLVVEDPAPVVTGVYPPTGFVSSTVTPQLSAASYVPGGGSPTYSFSVTCHPLAGTTCPAGVFGSGTISSPNWTVSPPLQWNEPYTWSVIVTDGSTAVEFGPVSITPEVPQPLIGSRLGGSSGQAFDPQTGDYTTSATDAAVSVAGPPLQIVRTYNSLDPDETGAFGAGWSSVLDMNVAFDDVGNNDVVVTMADEARTGLATTA
ncbi:MAG: DNRLRE domain-containing protein [Streptosporangiaceae bacterium]